MKQEICKIIDSEINQLQSDIRLLENMKKYPKDFDVIELDAKIHMTKFFIDDLFFVKQRIETILIINDILTK